MPRVRFSLPEVKERPDRRPLSWALGLSHRSVSNLLTALGSALSRMSSWRDVQEADETMLRMKGEKVVSGFVTDAVSGNLLGIDLLVADAVGMDR